jgi:aldose 1-epimerase
MIFIIESTFHGSQNGVVSAHEHEDLTIMMTNQFVGTAGMPRISRVFLLRNASGMTVTISERDATPTSWRAPDRYGRMANVLLGDAEEPRAVNWQPSRWRAYQSDGVVSLLAQGISTDLQVSYRLNDDGSLVVDYDAMAGFTVPLKVKAAPCFNLSGCHADIGDHMLQIDADYFEETDAGGAPAGIASVGGTPFDFRQPAAIGSRLRWPDPRIDLAGGFDHCFFVRNHARGGQGALREVARVLDPASGRCLQVSTGETALRFCSGTLPRGLRERPQPKRYQRRDGFFLQSIARPEVISAAWPHVILQPGQMYRQTTVYRLSLQG